jgi:hypothetical protein
VQGSRGQFFAGAGFSGDQHRRAPSRHQSNDVADVAHFVAFAYQQPLPFFAAGVLGGQDQVTGAALLP